MTDDTCPALHILNGVATTPDGKSGGNPRHVSIAADVGGQRIEHCVHCRETVPHTRNRRALP